jgi:hypothetical protein
MKYNQSHYDTISTIVKRYRSFDQNALVPMIQEKFPGFTWKDMVEQIETAFIKEYVADDPSFDVDGFLKKCGRE